MLKTFANILNPNRLVGLGPKMLDTDDIRHVMINFLEKSLI